MLVVMTIERSVELYYGYESFVLNEALKRPFWAAGLSWIIYSSYYGHGGNISVL